MSKSNLEFRKVMSLWGLYEISSDGRIVRNVKSKKQTKQVPDKDGYMRCAFCIKGKTYQKHVHAMVCECWHGARPIGMQVDHIDGKRWNNDYRNLRYVTQSENMKKRKMSEHVIRIATENCRRYNESISKPITIKNSETEISFKSMGKCAEYIGKYYGINAECVRWRLKARRSHIYDFDIRYDFLNAETGHADFTE